MNQHLQLPKANDHKLNLFSLVYETNAGYINIVDLLKLKIFSQKMIKKPFVCFITRRKAFRGIYHSCTMQNI